MVRVGGLRSLAALFSVVRVYLIQSRAVMWRWRAPNIYRSPRRMLRNRASRESPGTIRKLPRQSTITDQQDSK